MGDLFPDPHEFVPPPNAVPPAMRRVPMRSGLDINTPKGQQTLVDEKRAVEIFEHHNPDLRYVHTPKDTAAVVDAMLVRDGRQIVYVVATTCRYGVPLDKLIGPFRNEWLLSLHKLENGRVMAVNLSVPLLGFLFLVDDDLLLTLRLADADGNWLCKYRTAMTLTQATVNGGQALRDNAFINMTGAVHLRARF